jgi:hypothetical protein
MNLKKLSTQASQFLSPTVCFNSVQQLTTIEYNKEISFLLVEGIVANPERGININGNMPYVLFETFDSDHAHRSQEAINL